MLANAYALDPQFFNVIWNIDQASQDGLLIVVERIKVRDVVARLRRDISNEEVLAAVVREYNSERPAVISRVSQCHCGYFSSSGKVPSLDFKAVVLKASITVTHEWW